MQGICGGRWRGTCWDLIADEGGLWFVVYGVFVCLWVSGVIGEGRSGGGKVCVDVVGKVNVNVGEEGGSGGECGEGVCGEDEGRRW